MTVHGCHDSTFARLVELLDRSIERGDDLGASVAIMLDGEKVVDVWGGFTDVDRTEPWRHDTITNVWSTTKTMTALVALVLVDRQLIDLDERVAEYWPEFGVNGKEYVQVRHLLSHTSGVAGWDPPVNVGDIFDHESAAERLAGQAPWWEPGSASGYHGISQGHLVGELVRRVTGSSLGNYFADEIAGPLAGC